MFGKKNREAATPPAGKAGAPANPKTASPQSASKGKQAYEARRAEKAGVGLEKWMADKQRRVQAERDAEQRARKAATTQNASKKKPGLLRRLLDRAHRPL